MPMLLWALQLLLQEALLLLPLLLPARFLFRDHVAHRPLHLLRLLGRDVAVVRGLLLLHDNWWCGRRVIIKNGVPKVPLVFRVHVPNFLFLFRRLLDRHGLCLARLER